MRSQPAKRRLRNRLVLRMGLLATVLAATLGAGTFLVVRDNLLDAREDSAIEQTLANARLLSSALAVAEVDVNGLLAAMRPQVRTRPLLLRSGQWYTASLQVQPDDIPSSLHELVTSGTTGVQRFRSEDRLLLGIGAELPADEGVYFELYDLSDVESTLRTLRNTLLAGGAAVSAAGVALGWWMARRISRPLEGVATAAVLIADGSLGARLRTEADQDLDQIAGAFNRMADSLEERIERESRFAADVSHELRSPLTTMLTSASVLENRRSELSPDGQRALDLLVADTQRLERMVEDLLEFARHDAGTATLSLNEFGVVGFVTSVLDRMHRNVPITVSDDAIGAIVLLDQRRTERAMVNVIDNAETYAGGVNEISIETRAAGVVVAVEDHGPGVPAEDREAIFERFARGTTRGRRGSGTGTGLGLALARENLRLQGGDLWVEDNEPTGSRFMLLLPDVP